jgi:hypothetical protein
MNESQHLQALKDTCEYYNIGNRATQLDGLCLYHTANGDRCAIGRLLTVTQAMYLGDREISVRNLIDELNPSVPMELEILSVLQQYDLEFLCQLQRLHDNDKYWGGEGLNAYGDTFANEIKIRLYELFEKIN